MQKCKVSITNIKSLAFAGLLNIEQGIWNDEY
jgi:hypothetical protein